MGYMRHHAIIVTSWENNHLKQAHDQARAIFDRNGYQVSDLLDSAINGYQSFMVPPDGSKEGWDFSDEGDANRAQFLQWLREQNLFVDAIEVQFADEDNAPAVVLQEVRYEER